MGFALNKPYPYTKNIQKQLLSYLIIGGFVSLFLIVFQPFDINLWETPHKTLKLLGFGFISFIVPTLISILIYIFIPSKTREEGWTVAREIIVILLVLLGIAFGNLFYSSLLHIVHISFQAFIAACTVTFLLGIFPVTMYVVVKHNSYLKLNLQQSLELNRQLETQALQSEVSTNAPGESPAEIKNNVLNLVAENGKDSLALMPEQLLFIESADNYSAIVFLENGKAKKQLLRSSLKRTESQIVHQLIIRCHRAYIVNLAGVKRVEGNAAGYRLYFSDPECSVPVSRAYISAVNQKLKNLS